MVRRGIANQSETNRMKLKLNESPRHFSMAAMLLLACALQAQNAIRYEPQPGSKLKVEGTSSIHDWIAESGALGGFMELDPAFDADLKMPTASPKVEVN